MDHIVDMREYDVPYHVRVSIDRKINVVSAVNISRKKNHSNCPASKCLFSINCNGTSKIHRRYLDSFILEFEQACVCCIFYQKILHVDKC